MIIIIQQSDLQDKSFPVDKLSEAFKISKLFFTQIKPGARRIMIILDIETVKSDNDKYLRFKAGNIKANKNTRDEEKIAWTDSKQDIQM